MSMVKFDIEFVYQQDYLDDVLDTETCFAVISNDVQRFHIDDILVDTFVDDILKINE
jgi:hypothetical protein